MKYKGHGQVKDINLKYFEKFQLHIFLQICQTQKIFLIEIPASYTFVLLNPN